VYFSDSNIVFVAFLPLYNEINASSALFHRVDQAIIRQKP
jgi:hypothetical protein